MTSPSATISRSALGISIPTADFPGIGERIRTSLLATAYEIFFDSAVIFSTFTALPSSTSYRVTVGPRINPVTSASISNCLKTSVSDATTVSFALLFAFAAGPTFSKSCEGNSYFVSLVSSNCSGRLSLLGAGAN
ncbi:unannotated protein [freshwater metagenome]|uniref:Unannotated protein n=1 Tax=freshwater metagenome TaxID=449393 RepID=A0A6J6BJH8_9ZZZZ